MPSVPNVFGSLWEAQFVCNSLPACAGITWTNAGGNPPSKGYTLRASGTALATPSEAFKAVSSWAKKTAGGSTLPMPSYTDAVAKEALNE